MDRIGIIVALAREAACLTGRPPRPDFATALDQHFGVILCGIGPERARRAADQFLELGAEALISFGTCGALTPALPSGAIVIPDTVIFNDETLPANNAWRAWAMRELASEPFRAQGGTLVTVDQPVADSSAKSGLHEQTGAVAADMESGAIFSAAQNAGIPAIALRVVLDGQSTELPAAVTRSCDAYGKPRYPMLLGEFLRNPRIAAKLLELLQLARIAGASMRLIAEHRHLLRVELSDLEPPPVAAHNR